MLLNRSVDSGKKRLNRLQNNILKGEINLKINRMILVPIAIVLLFVCLWAYFFWYPNFVMDQHIEELKNEGINVAVIVYDTYTIRI